MLSVLLIVAHWCELLIYLNNNIQNLIPGWGLEGPATGPLGFEYLLEYVD